MKSQINMKRNGAIINRCIDLYNMVSTRFFSSSKPMSERMAETRTKEEIEYDMDMVAYFRNRMKEAQEEKQSIAN